jgi:DNA ligase-1
MIVKRPKTYKKFKTNFPALVSPKLDGVRAIYKDNNLYTRTNDKILGMSHIIKEIKNLSLYPERILDGELTIPGKNFNIVSGLVRNYKEEPSVVFNIFDLFNFVCSKETRRIFLNKIFLNLNTKLKKIKLVEIYTVQNHNQLMDFYNWFLQRGFEGLIYYDKDSLYNNKKDYEWMKLFPNKSADCKVIGFEEGKGKNKNSLGALIVIYKNQICKIGTGFKELPWSYIDTKDDYINKDDYNFRVRKFIWDHQWMFIDFYCECTFKEETQDGKMRQPVFKGWRWDKGKE